MSLFVSNLFQNYEYPEICPNPNILDPLTISQRNSSSSQSPGSQSTSRSRPWHDFGRQNDADKIQIPKMWVLRNRKEWFVVTSRFTLLTTAMNWINSIRVSFDPAKASLTSEWIFKFPIVTDSRRLASNIS